MRRNRTTFDQYNLVKRIVSSGGSFREASIEAGVSQDTVARIVYSDAPVHISPGGQPTEPELGMGQVVLFHCASPVGRCPTCGRRIKLPCLACQLAEQKQYLPGVPPIKRRPYHEPPVDELEQNEIKERAAAIKAANMQEKRTEEVIVYKQAPHAIPTISEEILTGNRLPETRVM